MAQLFPQTAGEATLDRDQTATFSRSGTATDFEGLPVAGSGYPSRAEFSWRVKQLENSSRTVVRIIPMLLSEKRGLDSSVGSGFALWPRGRGFETQPSTVRAPTGWVGVSIM
ncbi:hypothetical protein ElyMa_004827500 [Elysia marginata]|uniref:COMM domain-containing protein n=1 Tax=Elysia marginata TaxID=1093978 RepID=A0AAV4IMQ6_9GAST|nr:hypothetical protein ElyMa_004827500 [Elysia marginata]